jgi:hypothetical protein
MQKKMIKVANITLITLKALEIFKQNRVIGYNDDCQREEDQAHIC